MIDKDNIINLFIENEVEIISAVNSKNFYNIEKINGIQSIRVLDDYNVKTYFFIIFS